MKFEFRTASQILFGTGKSAGIPAVWQSMGSNPLFITGRSTLENLSLKEIIAGYESDIVSQEPTTKLVEAFSSKAREMGVDVIIAIGGGSVIDAGKAVAAITPNTGSLLDYLEVIGKGKMLENNPLPFIAVPTTAGTGTEATKNAVIFSPEHKVKVSLRDPRMFPDAAIIDPALTYSMPEHITINSGADAFVQCIEPYVSHLSTPMTDPLCLDGIRLIADALPQVVENPKDVQAREAMALGSLYGGIALGNAKLGAVHGFAGPIGGMFSAPHGAVCASLLVPVVEVNIRVMSERNLQNRAVGRYEDISRIVTGNATAGHAELLEWLRNFAASLKFPRLSDFGITKEDFPAIIEKSKVSSSMKGNPILLNDLELREILEKAI